MPGVAWGRAQTLAQDYEGARGSVKCASCVLCAICGRLEGDFVPPPPALLQSDILHLHFQQGQGFTEAARGTGRRFLGVWTKANESGWGCFISPRSSLFCPLHYFRLTEPSFLIFFPVYV